MPKKGKSVRKIKSPFMIFVDFESILLLPENNKKKNLEDPYTKKYQKQVACSYSHKVY